MYVERHAVTVTTGTATGEGYTPVVTGRLISIRYVKPESGGYSDGVDFVVTTETSGLTLWDQQDVNASVTVAPRQATTDNAGVDAVYAADGEAVLDHIYIAAERIKIAIAAGGNGTTGTFHITIA